MTYACALETAQNARQDSFKHYQLRNENFKKAQEHYRTGNAEVARYYSQLVSCCLFDMPCFSQAIDIYRTFHFALSSALVDIIFK